MAASVYFPLNFNFKAEQLQKVCFPFDANKFKLLCWTISIKWDKKNDKCVTMNKFTL